MGKYRSVFHTLKELKNKSTGHRIKSSYEDVGYMFYQIEELKIFDEILKEFPIVLTMTMVQNIRARKPPILIFLILNIFVVFGSKHTCAHDIYNLYASGIIQFNKSLVTSSFFKNELRYF
jgi:hypothetical protein